MTSSPTSRRIAMAYPLPSSSACPSPLMRESCSCTMASGNPMIGTRLYEISRSTPRWRNDSQRARTRNTVFCEFSPSRVLRLPTASSFRTLRMRRCLRGSRARGSSRVLKAGGQRHTIELSRNYSRGIINPCAMRRIDDLPRHCIAVASMSESRVLSATGCSPQMWMLRVSHSCASCAAPALVVIRETRRSSSTISLAPSHPN